MKKLINVLIICTLPLLSQAAIIYTSVNPAQSFQMTGNFGSNLIPVDFNGDAVNEIRFRYDVFGGPQPEWFSHTFELSSSKVARTGTTNPYGAAYAMKFNSGSLINASSFTATNGFDPLLADNADSSFVNQGYKFIGVRFVAGGNTYYGWVSVQMTSVNGLKTVYVNGYAYENTPSTGITAGDTGSSVSQPTANTAAATAISASGATLNGMVNANNAATTVTFEYGTTTAYGSSVSATPGTVTGTTATAVSATISGLQAGKVYHYRLKAVNSGGTTYSSDATFSTTTTGIAQVGQVSACFLFPNPASATVQLNNPERQAAKVMVTDALGHFVWQGELAADKETLSIDTTPWATGNYMVILQTPDRRNTVLQLAVRR